MYDVENKVRLLIDILGEKEKLLAQVLCITENQEGLFLSGEPMESVAPFFNGMNREKQKLIERTMLADNVFQKTFDDISADFEAFAGENKELVGYLQQCVRTVMDIDIKIRVLELQNKELVEKQKKGRRIELPKAQKGYMLEQYKKFNQSEE